jgi:hypothetical protein
MTDTCPDLIAQQLEAICPDLALHIARCCEQAYRRGYQQGALYGHGLDQQVCNWRFDVPDDIDLSITPASARYDTSMAPPDRRDLGLHKGLHKAAAGTSYGYTTSAVERLSFEAGNCSDVVCALAHSATA